MMDLARIEGHFRAQPEMHPFRMSASLFFVVINLLAHTAHTMDNPRAFANEFAVIVWIACGFMMLLAAFTGGYWLPRIVYAGFVPLTLLFIYQFRVFYEAPAFLMAGLSLVFVALSCLHGLIWKRAVRASSKPLNTGFLPQYSVSLIDLTVLGTVSQHAMSSSMEGGASVGLMIGVVWLYVGTLFACRFSGKWTRLLSLCLLLAGFRAIARFSPDMGAVCDVILLVHAGLFLGVKFLSLLLQRVWPIIRARVPDLWREGARQGD